MEKKKKRVPLGKPLPIHVDDEPVPTESELLALSDLWDAFAPKEARGMTEAVSSLDIPEGWTGWVFDSNEQVYIIGSTRIGVREAREFLRAFTQSLTGTK